MLEHVQKPFVIAGLLLASGPAYLPSYEADGVKVDSYLIDAEFHPADKSIHATVDISFAPSSVTGDTLVFYLHGELDVDHVEVQGQRIEILQDRVHHENDYSHIANRVSVVTDDIDRVEGMRVMYSGYFNPSVVGAISNYMRIDSGGVFLRSLGYSLWFPVFVENWTDSYDVSFPSVTIRTPREFRAVFAGQRLREYEEGEWRISEWSADRLSLFDAQCTARQFDVMNEGGFYLYHMRDSTARTMARDILSFSQRLEVMYQAHYRSGLAVQQLHIMQMPEYGNISSGTTIGISDEVWNQFEATAWQGRTLAHEMVHPFVRLPSNDEMAAFVIEGFPGYFHLPALAEILGERWYRDYMAGVERAYINKRKTGKSRRGADLPTEKPILEIQAQEIGTYKDTFVLSDRVKLFFDYLRRRIGSERFFEFSFALLNQDSLDYETMVAVVESYLPDSRSDVFRWLRTDDFPGEFRLDGSD